MCHASIGDLSVECSPVALPQLDPHGGAARQRGRQAQQVRRELRGQAVAAAPRQRHDSAAHHLHRRPRLQLPAVARRQT